MGFFDKKYCDVCGDKIGLLGNRKLEDGNLCKNCAAKLSPWFDERRHSTVEQIKEQLAYREDNMSAVEAFEVSRSFGEYYKLLIDDRHQAFLVTNKKNYKETNPDIIKLSQVTGCDLKIEEGRYEEYRTDKEGNSVSFNPPRYTYHYDFYIILRINSPWFNEIKFRLNSSTVNVTSDEQRAMGFRGGRLIDMDHSCQNYVEMAEEIKAAMKEGPVTRSDMVAAAAAQNGMVTCPYCGTLTRAASFCQNCGGTLT